MLKYNYLFKSTKSLIILFCYGIAGSFHGIAADADSLKKILPGLKSDTSKITVLNQLCRAYSSSDPEKAISYCKEAMALAEKVNNLKYLAESYTQLGNYSRINLEFPSALSNYLKALKIYEQLHEKKSIAKLYSHIGSIYYNQNQYKQALSYYKKSLIIYEQLKDSINLVTPVVNIGNQYYMLYKYDSASYYYLKNIEIREKLGQKQELIYAYANIGDLYTETTAYNKAIAYYNKSLDLSRKHNQQEGMANAYSGIATAHTKQEKYKDALYSELKSLEISKKTGNLQMLKYSYEHLSLIYEKLNQPTQSLEYYKLFNSLKDSIFNLESSAQIAEMETKYQSEKKEQQIALLNKEKQKDKVVRFALGGGVLMLLAMGGLVLNRYRLKQKANKKLEEKNKLIELAYSEIEQNRNEIEEKNKDITDSIRYAKRIQEAILPPEDVVKKLLHESFILYKPKDIVCGDFYWLEGLSNLSEDVTLSVSKSEETAGTFMLRQGQHGALAPLPSEGAGGRLFLAAVDCTGHGVPGAFMSLVGHNLLNQAVNERALTEPADILNSMNKGLTATLRQTFEESSVRDGMDIALISIENQGSGVRLKYAGANNPLWIIRDGDLMEFQPDKFPIGIFIGEEMKSFTQQEVQLQKGDIIYIFSDGYADQFGGDKGKKFMKRNFKELILGISEKPMTEQKELLEKAHDRWKGNHEQVDDILVMGVRV